MTNQNSNPTDGKMEYLPNIIGFNQDAPREISKLVTGVREKDAKIYDNITDSLHAIEQLEQNNGADSKKIQRFSYTMQKALIAMQENFAEKINFSQQLIELTEMKSREVTEYSKEEVLPEILKQERERAQSPALSVSKSSNILPYNSGAMKTSSEKNGNSSSIANMGSNNNISSLGLTSSSTNNNNNGNNNERTAKRARRTRTDTGMDIDSDVPIKTEISESKQQMSQTSPFQKKMTTSGGSNKKKKKKVGRQHNIQSSQQTVRETPISDPIPQEDSINPDEPTYCLCEQISFGEMVCCDNSHCPIEWFHFSCVSLINKPKGRWYCPNCRGDRPTVMKSSKAQVSKERYKKEKF